jgi:hypothetical protein
MCPECIGSNPPVINTIFFIVNSVTENIYPIKYALNKSMNFSFIICTHEPDCERVDISIKTIEDLRIPNYEILVIGGKRTRTYDNSLVRFVEFNEEIRPGWTTKKKNDAAKLAQYQNLCIFHDYFAFDVRWYEGWLKFNAETSEWNVACNPIFLVNGSREWTDWITWDDPTYGKSCPILYHDHSRTQYQYVSGGYFCIKKKFFLENLFSEELGSHEAEDIEWSMRIRPKWKLVCNPYSIVRHTKWHRDINKWRKHEKIVNRIQHD